MPSFLPRQARDKQEGKQHSQTKGHTFALNQVWDDWGGMRQEKKNHRIEFPLRFDLAPYMAENVRAKHVTRIQAEMAGGDAAAAAAAAAGDDAEGGEAAEDGGAEAEAAAAAATTAADAAAGDDAADGGAEAPEPVWYTFLGAIIHSGVAGRERPVSRHFYTENDHFTKTCSGQTSSRASTQQKHHYHCFLVSCRGRSLRFDCQAT